MVNLGSTAPTAPNTQHTAIGALVADAMSKANNVNQKQLESQKEINQQFMEQSIANAIQQIQDSAPSNAVALAEVKQFLTQMSQDDSTWGADVRSWISGELNTADSYVPQTNFLYDFYLNSQKALAILANSPEACKIFYEFTGITKEDLEKFSRACGAAAHSMLVQIENRDPKLADHLEELASGNNMMHQEANENVSGYNSIVQKMQGFDKSIEGIIAELAAGAQSSGAV